MIKQILLEPLTHFILIAISFFIIFDVMTPEQDDNKSITVTNGRIEQLNNRFSKVWQREPTEAELSKLIENYTLDEIYTLEARALGLDIDDGIIRRRLRQKMEFMLQDMVAIVPPTEPALQSFYQQSQDKYKSADQYSFSHVFISTDRPRAELESLLEKQQKNILNNKKPTGDNSLLPAHLELAVSGQVDRLFGKKFVQALQNAPLNEWHGPIRSGLGLHFIKLDKYIKGELPALARVKEKVLNDWRYQKNITFKKAFEQKLLKEYQVNIQQPTLLGQ